MSAGGADREGRLEATAEPARLRPHHLICLRYFVGEGYSQGFVDNLAGVLAQAGERLIVVAGADDVCAACPSLDPCGRCAHAPGADEEIRRLDALAARLLGVVPGEALRFGDLGERVTVVLAEWTAQACADCEWLRVCERAQDAGAGSGRR